MRAQRVIVKGGGGVIEKVISEKVIRLSSCQVIRLSTTQQSDNLSTPTTCQPENLTTPT
jgi:hypothetical protein